MPGTYTRHNERTEVRRFLKDVCGIEGSAVDYYGDNGNIRKIICFVNGKIRDWEAGLISGEKLIDLQRLALEAIEMLIR